MRTASRTRSQTPSRAASRTTGIVAAVAIAAAVALVATSCGSGGDVTVTRSNLTVPQASADAPNVVVIVTDDQTVEQMRVMTRTNELLGEQGTTFTNFFTPFPLCCPSRATYLTGQYAFNHGVVDNLGPNGGYYALNNTNTLPVWLNRAGYTTSLVGHYLYRYGTRERTEIPPGWDRWFATLDPSTFSYFNYNVNDNGRVVSFGDAEEDYQTDVMADRTVQEIYDLSEGDRPFFLNLWTLAPHVAEPETRSNAPNLQSVPAPRHRGLFEQEWWTSDEAPSFDEEDVSDKPLYVQNRARMLPVTQISAQANYQRALESLLAVDEAIGRIVDALDETGELDNTVIMLWSDNGFLQGEHRIRDAKTVPYEEAIRVPLVIRGPGFPAGATAPQLTANLDLAPTILELAGVSGGLEPDGQSLLPMVADADPPPDDRVIYLQNGPAPDEGADIPHFEGVRVPGYTYVEYAPGTLELYDLAADPYQLDNVAGDPAYTELQAQLADLLDQMRDCQGATCREPRFVPPD